MTSSNDNGAGRIEPDRPTSDARHENAASGDRAMEADLDEEKDPTPRSRADGADELHLDP